MTEKMTLSMSAEQYRVLNEFADVNDVAKSRIVRQALYHYMTDEAADFKQSDEVAKAFKSL